MTRILILDIPAPCKFINSNQRLHPLAKARLTAQWREAGRLSVPKDSEPFTGRVRVLAHVWKPRGGRWDPNNWHPTTKAIVDGLVEAGLLADDDHEHVIGPDHRRGGIGPARIVLTIEEAS